MAAQIMAEMAAFEAVGHAKFTGRIGFCSATSGPGAVHLLNGLYDAKLDHVAVVAIVGQTNRSAMGGSYYAAGVAARHVRADQGRRIA
jgi:pyruvate dehydrogenase (quinone)